MSIEGVVRERAHETQLLRRANIQRPLQARDARGTPFGEVLVLTDDEKRAERKAAKFRRHDGEDPVKVLQMWRAGVGDCVDGACARFEDKVVAIQVAVESEVFDQRLCTDLPSTAIPAVQLDVELHILRRTPIHQIAVSPRAIQKQLRREGLERLARLPQVGVSVRHPDVGDP